MNSANKRLLFVGVSSMKDHAGQHKLYFLADAFARQGIPVTVLVPDLEENRLFLSSKPHIESLYYPMRGALADARSKTAVLAQDRWSVVWIVGVGIRSFIFRGRRHQHIPIVKDFDEFPSMIESFGQLRRAYLRWIERRMIAQADGFTCASEFLENTVRAQRPGLGPRLLRLRVAISKNEHQVDPALLSQLRAADAGKPTFLYIGSVWRFYEDQLDEVIKLAATLHRRKINARVRILGGGPDMDYFKAKAARLAPGAALEFAGHVPREALASYMEAADVLVFPFPTNPFNLSRCPTKAFHYAAANRPVVTNKVGEVAALLGDSALYYPEHDADAMADRCVEALALRERFHNNIPFRSLTWDELAVQFATWLRARGFMPAARPVPAATSAR